LSLKDNITPLFSTSASLKEGGIFVIDKAGAAADAKHSKGPVNLVDLAKEEKLPFITLVESNFVNFMSAYKNLTKIGCQFRFGLRLVVCEDLNNKTDESFKTESKIIIFLQDDKAYKNLINIYTKASTDGFYYIPRIDWKTLKEFWSDGLILALPFYSSFLARNLLSFSSIMPELPANPVLLKEIGQELPFDGLINKSLEKYSESNKSTIENVKSIYYKNRDHAKSFLIYRAILGRKTWDKPNMDGMSSREFCWESYKELLK
jgi:DNA polymerase III alpha subunit